MKRFVSASKYTNESNKTLKWLSNYALVLADVCNAETDEELAQAVSSLGYASKYMLTKPDAVSSIMGSLTSISERYLTSVATGNMFPKVKEDLLVYLRGKNYPMTPISNVVRGFDESYVILPADECEHKDLAKVASAISREFGVKPDTGVIGGSWTSYQFDIGGVKFRIGFERDYDYDPSGKESSLQLSF